MTDLFAQHPLIVVIGALVILALLFLAFRPRQRVTLTDSAPVRPHMASSHAPEAHEGRGVGDEFAAATSDVAGDIFNARIHANLPGAGGPPDDLLLLKGVGPKLAELLNARGLTRFDQIASLSEGQLETLDSSLGAFRGRLARDRVTEQADYLARGDTDGFEQKFGKL
ncbi:hypothetical protein ABDK56_06985 [Sphingomonas sp. ASV193]|uniref:hypothetical protein n=1 Tax=Sphingomonas sp. ASV193 TaxID=3144405 RepID=UPI0032E89548